MKCPNCGLTCPDETQRCDCGYDFVAGQMAEPLASAAGRRKRWISAAEAIVVVVFIAVLVAICIPSFVRPSPPRQNYCINNLRQIDSGKEQAALAYRWADDAPCVVTIVNQYIKGNTTPLCPEGGAYTYGAMNVQPTCSYRGTSTTHKLPPDP